MLSNKKIKIDEDQIDARKDYINLISDDDDDLSYKNQLNRINFINSNDNLDFKNSFNNLDTKNRINSNHNLDNKNWFNSNYNLERSKKMLFFKLDWELNKKIINILNDFIESLLINQQTTLTNENNLFKNNEDLIKRLCRLELSKPSDKLNSCKLILKLDYEFRFLIINQLIKNADFSIHNRKILEENDKKNLIEENKDLVIKLMNINVESTFDDLIDKKRKLNDYEGKISKYIKFNFFLNF